MSNARGMSISDRLYRAHNEVLMSMGGWQYESNAIVSGNQSVMSFGNTIARVSNTGSLMGGDVSFVSGKHLKNIQLHGSKVGNVFDLQRGWGSTAFSSLGAFGTVAGMGLGFQADGLMGMVNAASIDYGMMLGVRTFSGRSFEKIADTTNYVQKTGGWGRSIVGGIGGLVGATVGNSILGAPGSIIGGVAGAGMATHRAGWALGAAGVAGATLGYGAYSYLKTGYRRGRDIRMGRVPHTAGDTSSFFTQNAFTMRSQAIQAMRNSHLNARTALGQEATFMHMNKNYFSTYR